MTKISGSQAVAVSDWIERPGMGSQLAPGRVFELEHLTAHSTG